MSAWQPIETAPKDGTYVVLWGAGRRVTIGKYHDSQTFEYGKLVRQTAEWQDGWVHFKERPAFTHWMALPEPPVGDPK